MTNGPNKVRVNARKCRENVTKKHVYTHKVNYNFTHISWKVVIKEKQLNLTNIKDITRFIIFL